MPTLTEVRREVVPAAAWLSPPTGPTGDPPSPDPVVGWVRVLRARVPAFEGLEPGDLAIVPEPVLSALDAGPAEPAAVVDELSRVGVCAALLTGEGEPGPAAGRLVEAARLRSWPVLRLVGADPAAVERSIVGYLVNRHAELDRQAAHVEASVERLALEGLGLDAVAGAVGGALGRAVAIEDERGVAIALHAPTTVPGAAAAAARYIAQPRQAALRVPVPGAGSLALLGPQAPSDLDRAVAERVAPLLALEMGRRSGAGRWSARAGGAEALPADGPPWVAIVARQAGPPGAGLEETGRAGAGRRASAQAPAVAGRREGTRLPADRLGSPGGPGRSGGTGLTDTGREERERVRERLSRLAPPRRLELRGDVTSVDLRLLAALDADDPRGIAIATRIAETIGRDVGVSRPFSTAEERSAAEAEARATLEAAEAVPAGDVGPRVVLADRVPAYRVLGELHNLPNGARLARALLAPLLVGSPSARRRRLATLRAVLEHPGAAAAAEALGVHRNTLLYRAGRIEERTGWRLDDPELRLALSVAVRLVQSDQLDD